jgi:hypothetical protein
MTFFTVFLLSLIILILINFKNISNFLNLINELDTNISEVSKTIEIEALVKNSELVNENICYDLYLLEGDELSDLKHLCFESENVIEDFVYKDFEKYNPLKFTIEVGILDIDSLPVNSVNITALSESRVEEIATSDFISENNLYNLYYPNDYMLLNIVGYSISSNPVKDLGRIMFFKGMITDISVEDDFLKMDMNILVNERRQNLTITQEIFNFNLKSNEISGYYQIDKNNFEEVGLEGLYSFVFEYDKNFDIENYIQEITNSQKDVYDVGEMSLSYIIEY